MKNEKIKTLTEGAIMVALATVLSLLKFSPLPWGGSVTLLSMLPIVVFSIKHGVREGLAVSFLYSLMQLGLAITMDGLLGWGLNPIMLISCIFLDYVLAFSSLGLAGVFRKRGFAGWLCGTGMAIVIRFVLHVFSGVFVFASCGLLWEGFSTDNLWIYSSLYNGSYMLPELVFTLIGATVLFKVPVIKRLVTVEG